ncbi:MAG: hypothetical protein JO279_07170 [Verrucomicrobia bacterium]|nr:hypothetical protein [Verrucomicrobiota bacterium]
MKTAFLLFLAATGPLLADTLEKGSVYFDSRSTLKEVVDLSAKKDAPGILQLMQSGHVITLPAEIDIEVLSSGNDPDSPAEFRFLTGPTTYWTLTKFIAKEPTAPIPGPTPSPSPAVLSTPGPHPTPTPALTPSLHHPRPRPGISPDNAPGAPPGRKKIEHGPRVWHLVDGTWKWYYPQNASEFRRHHLAVKRAEPVEPKKDVGPIPEAPLYRNTLP